MVSKYEPSPHSKRASLPSPWGGLQGGVSIETRLTHEEVARLFRSLTVAARIEVGLGWGRSRARQQANMPRYDRLSQHSSLDPAVAPVEERDGYQNQNERGRDLGIMEHVYVDIAIIYI